jgi:hypothetical protein
VTGACREDLIMIPELPEIPEQNPGLGFGFTGFFV